MKMTEKPKPNSEISSRDCGRNDVEAQKTLGSDQVNGIQYKTEKSDSCVLDMESFSNGISKDISANSRITLQRSLSRKGPQRSGEKKPNSVATFDADAVLATSSPRAALVGGSTLEKPVAMVVAAAAGTTDHHSQAHHHIAITAGSISTATEGRCISKRYSFRRASSSSSSWHIDPRRVLLFFATLSSMGTILLLYFTFSMRRLAEDDNEFN